MAACLNEQVSKSDQKRKGDEKMSRLDMLDMSESNMKLVTEIEELRPISRKTPLEDRRVANHLIRQKLSVASNDVISYLAIRMGHQLSAKELVNRLATEKFNSLSELFRLCQYTGEVNETRFTRKILSKGLENVKRIAPNAEQSEIIEIMRDFIGTIVIERTAIFYDTLSERSDKKEITEKIKDFYKGAPSNNLRNVIDLFWRQYGVENRVLYDELTEESYKIGR